MQAHRVLRAGPKAAGGDPVWTGPIAVGLLCLVGAVGVGRGAGLSGFVGLVPALVIAALRASRPGALPGRWPRVPAVFGLPPTLRLPPAWAPGLAAMAGFLTAATPRADLGMALVLGVTAVATPRLRGYWAVALPAALCAGLTLFAARGLGAPRLAEACLLQGLTAAAMAAAVVRAADGRPDAGEAGSPWLLLVGALAAGAVAAALADIRGGVLAALLVGAFTIAVADGPGTGALGGAIAGLICLPAVGGGTFAPGAAALAGAAAGLCRRQGALVAALSGCGAAVLVAAVATPGEGWWAVGACAGTGLWALWRLERQPRAGDPGAGKGGAGAGHRRSLPERLRAAAATCLELSRGLADEPVLTGLPEGRASGLRIAEEVCPGCPALTACWERKLPRAQRMVSGLSRRAETEPVSGRDVGGPDTIFCLRPREMAEAANRHAALAHQREEFLRLVEASRRTAIGPLVGIGRVLADLAEEVAAAGEAAPLPQPGAAPARLPVEERWSAPAEAGRLGFEVTGASLSRPGAAVSGDSFRCRTLPGERLALVVSDGMGSGGPAAVASAAAVEQLLAHLAAGVAADEALRATNAHLLADSAAERFATIQLAVIHLRQSLLEWHCMGAPAGLLRHARGVREWGGGGLPAGILSDPEIRSGRARLREGDLLVMVSDGVGEPGSGGGALGSRTARPRWLLEWLRADWDKNQRTATAARLLAVARERSVGEHDDLTALFCRLSGGGEGVGDRTQGGALVAGSAAGAARLPPMATR